MHHLTPNSILHISIFVHLCEAFLGIEPHFDLFCHLFQLKPYPNSSNTARVGGADLQLRPGMDKVYIPYKPHTKLVDWKTKWFYVGNHEPSLPDRVPGPPVLRNEWSRTAGDEEQVTKLLD